VADLQPGLYESLVTEGLSAALERLGPNLVARPNGLRPAEAADRIAWHLSREIERALADVEDGQRVAVGIEVARALLTRLGDLVEADASSHPVDPGLVLRSVLPLRPDGTAGSLPSPLIPLLDTTLLTNAPGEPNLWSQLRSEVESADAIDVVMAFIRRSGIAPLLNALARHVADGRVLRVLTTTYTGSTERRALEQLEEAGAQIRVSYVTDTTRQGVGVPSALGVFHGLCRLVEPDALGAGDRHRVERPGFRRPQPRSLGQVRRGLRELLGKWRLRAI
jgi:hypothetical protein